MRPPLALAAVMAVGLAGCGGGALSATDLRTAAARACDRATTRINRIAVPSSPAGGEQFLAGGVRVLRPELATLRSLQPPSALAGSYAAAVGSVSAEVTALQTTVASLHDGTDPIAAIQTLARMLAPLQARGNQAWSAVGVPACFSR